MDYVDICWKLVKDKPMKATNLKKATSPDNVSPRDLWQVGDSTTHSPLLINKSFSPQTGTCQMLIPSLKKVHQLMLKT